MNTLLNKDEWIALNDIIKKTFSQIGCSADQATNAFIDLCNKIYEYSKEENPPTIEIRGGKGNQRMGLVQPSTSTKIESPNLKDNLEIFNADYDDNECTYIIPTVIEKPIKMVLETNGDEFMWKEDVNLDIN